MKKIIGKQVGGWIYICKGTVSKGCPGTKKAEQADLQVFSWEIIF